jgi:peroxiredoxin
MITELNESTLDVLKSGDFCILMYFSDQCAYCQKVKEPFEKLTEEFPKYKFYKIPMTEQTYEFYSKFVPKEKVMGPALNDDGSPILRANGEPLLNYQKDENDNVVENSPITVPNFFVFNSSSGDESNEYGFLGSVSGNVDELKAILTNIQAMEGKDGG